MKGNDGYPLCNVAMYLHTANSEAKDAFGQPGEGRATYLYGHARDGMFGPIYELAIQKKQAKKMLGMVVQVYTSDLKLHLYEIREYRLHVTDLDGPLSATSEELWLQTSEGPKGTPRQDAAAGLPDLGLGRGPRGRPAQGQAGEVRLSEVARRAQDLDPVDPAQEQGGDRRPADHERGHQPEPGCPRRPRAPRPASLMPKSPATAPMPARITVTPVRRFMIVDRLLLIVDR